MDKHILMDIVQLTKKVPTQKGDGHQLTNTHEEDLILLKEINFQIPKKSSFAITGESGAGKSTLLSLLAGLDLPSEGQIVVDQVVLNQQTEEQRAQWRRFNVGFIFQQFHLIPHLTALENVMVPLDLLGNVSQKESQERAMELLNQVGLGQRMKHLPNQMSGGEQQRVAIARAFANRPKILFADEPTGNLDFATSARMVDALFALNDLFETTLILVTHDLTLAAKCQLGIELNAGSIVKTRSSI
jgi:putative ABC transport system ATP-binding protein